MKMETLKLDEIDEKILEILQEDSTVTAKEMGGILKLSPTPVYERIKKLENAGFITGYVALVDPIMVGKRLTVFINMTIFPCLEKSTLLMFI